MTAPVSFEVLPAGTGVEHLPIVSEDGATSLGFHYSRGGERSVICITHPRGGLERHYMIPAMIEAGFAVFAFNHRYRLDDYDLLSEVLLIDIAAAINKMKGERGYEKILLFGNSGGGGPFTYYQWQAELAPPGRFTHTPGGESLDLNRFDLPAADGLILLAAGFGESVLAMRWIDPSVIDEHDPLSCDRQLDMYDSRNGYREPPASSRYSADFQERYRAAQRQRVARIDARAHAYIADQIHWQEQMRDPGFDRLSVNERSYIRRRANDYADMVIFRTTAALENADMSIYPSKRVPGSFMTFDTHHTNYRNYGGLGWRRTPRAWLSATSGLSSRSTMRHALPHIKVPTLVMGYTADRGIYPADVEEMLAISAAEDKTLFQIDGDHFGLPIDQSSERAPRDTVGRHMRTWMRDRFPSR